MGLNDMKTRILGAVLGLAGLAAADAAPAADLPYRHRPARAVVTETVDPRLPSCADAGVHGYIVRAFAAREREYWGSGLVLSDFTRPYELGYRSWGSDFIPRRFCGAHTVTNDGRRREVYWLVAESLGTFGVGPGVDWCVTGLDRHYAYAPNCKMARP